MREAFGTIVRHLGDGKFEIKVNGGAGVIVAQVLPVPGAPDYFGTIHTRQAVNDYAPRLIGREVVAEVRTDLDRELIGFAIHGEVTQPFERGGYMIVKDADVDRIERRLGP